MASRRKARELALQMLFQWEVGKHSPDHVLSSFLKGQRVDVEEENFARELFEGAVAEAPALDKMLGDQAENWRLDRMAAVDRNVLRLALYELLRQPGTSPAVVINEALEIARKFSGERSVEFVNGVLDAIVKKLPISQPAAGNTEPPAAKSSKSKPQTSRTKAGAGE